MFDTLDGVSSSVGGNDTMTVPEDPADCILSAVTGHPRDWQRCIQLTGLRARRRISLDDFACQDDPLNRCFTKRIVGLG
jgi:hypothetical protein